MSLRDTPRIELPVALIVGAFFLITAFQTAQLVREHNNLAVIYDAQEASLQQATKIRTQFQTLASETAKLAEAGDDGAKAVVSRLSAQGITIHPSGVTLRSPTP